MAKGKYGIARDILLEELKKSKARIFELLNSDTGIRAYDELQKALDKYRSCLISADVLAGYEPFEDMKYYREGVDNG